MKFKQWLETRSFKVAKRPNSNLIQRQEAELNDLYLLHRDEKYAGQHALVLMDIKDIVPTENLNELSQDEYEDYSLQFQRNKPVQPISVDNNNRIIDGHHRFKAAIDNGISKIWALKKI